MAAKTIFALCASALFVQSIAGQCIGSAMNAGVVDVLDLWPGYEMAGWAGNGQPGYGYGLAGKGYGAARSCGFGNAVATGNGGAFIVSSYSPITPTGIYVESENAIEGALIVTGDLPFLSTVALEGQLPTSGLTGLSYGCGNGNIGIVSEGLAGAAGYGAGLAGAGLAGAAGYGAGLAGGCGYGLSPAAGFVAAPVVNGVVGGCGCGAVNYY